MHLLVMEDDPELARWIGQGLESAGHVVDAFEDGRDALVAAMTREYDVLVLDRMVPGVDGMSLLRAIRTAGNATPVLFLTALGDVDDRVEGLEAGADDYLAKPFAFSELAARVSALGRRPAAGVPETTTLNHKDLTLDLLGQRCTRAGQAIDLNPKEFRLLETFMRGKGRVLTRTMLLERVWNIDFDPSTSVVETHLSRLRAKVDKPFDEPLIRTIRGAGYVFGD